MFKLIFRVALASAVVWMLVPHGSDPGFARPGLPAVKNYFGWLDTRADVNGQRPQSHKSRPAGILDTSAVRDCTSGVAPKQGGRNGEMSQPIATETTADQEDSAPACPQ